MAKKKLPRFELKINPSTNAIVSAMALVEDPAMESNFLSFNKNFIEEAFATSDEMLELIGAAMIPNKVIYRRNEKTGEEYEVFFSKDTIREIAQQYFKQGFQNQMNLHHSATPAKSYIFQSYIVDNAKGIPSPKGVNVVDGSWIVGVKVEDADVWKDIKAGKVQGFSIEGLFEYSDEQFSKEDNNVDDILKELIQQMNTITNRIKNTK